jgi:hypothetical protein
LILIQIGNLDADSPSVNWTTQIKLERMPRWLSIHDDQTRGPSLLIDEPVEGLIWLQWDQNGYLLRDMVVALQTNQDDYSDDHVIINDEIYLCRIHQLLKIGQNGEILWSQKHSLEGHKVFRIHRKSESTSSLIYALTDPTTFSLGCFGTQGQIIWQHKYPGHLIDLVITSNQQCLILCETNPNEDKRQLKTLNFDGLELSQRMIPINLSICDDDEMSCIYYHDHNDRETQTLGIFKGTSSSETLIPTLKLDGGNCYPKCDFRIFLDSVFFCVNSTEVTLVVGSVSHTDQIKPGNTSFLLVKQIR